MKKIACYETSDGVIHREERKATKHAEERYGALLMSLAKRLVAIEKYADMSAFLEVDDNLDEFVELQKLKADIKLNDWEEDDD